MGSRRMLSEDKGRGPPRREGRSRRSRRRARTSWAALRHMTGCRRRPRLQGSRRRRTRHPHRRRRRACHRRSNSRQTPGRSLADGRGAFREGKRRTGGFRNRRCSPSCPQCIAVRPKRGSRRSRIRSWVRSSSPTKRTCNRRRPCTTGRSSKPGSARRRSRRGPRNPLPRGWRSRCSCSLRTRLLGHRHRKVATSASTSVSALPGRGVRPRAAPSLLRRSLGDSPASSCCLS